MLASFRLSGADLHAGDLIKSIAGKREILHRNTPQPQSAGLLVGIEQAEPTVIEQSIAEQRVEESVARHARKNARLGHQLRQRACGVLHAVTVRLASVDLEWHAGDIPRDMVDDGAHRRLSLVDSGAEPIDWQLRDLRNVDWRFGELLGHGYRAFLEPSGKEPHETSSLGHTTAKWVTLGAYFGFSFSTCMVSNA